MAFCSLIGPHLLLAFNLISTLLGPELDFLLSSLEVDVHLIEYLQPDALVLGLDAHEHALGGATREGELGVLELLEGHLHGDVALVLFDHCLRSFVLRLLLSGDIAETDRVHDVDV